MTLEYLQSRGPQCSKARLYLEAAPALVCGLLAAITDLTHFTFDLLLPENGLASLYSNTGVQWGQFYTSS